VSYNFFKCFYETSAFIERAGASVLPFGLVLRSLGSATKKVDSPLFEIALVLVRLDHVASIRDNGQRVDLRYTTVSKCDMAKPTQAAVSQVNLVGIGLADFPRLFWGEHPPFTPVGVGGGNF
jgi:hypothetical protein